VLNLRFRKPVELTNGVVVEERRVDGVSEVVVRFVPVGLGGLLVGDTIVAENTLGVSVGNAPEFSNAINLLQDQGNPVADLEIRRDGQPNQVSLELVK